MLKKIVLLGAAGILGLSASGVCLAASSCVTCHTDEDMLVENLSKVKGVTSAMQAGAG